MFYRQLLFFGLYGPVAKTSAGPFFADHHNEKKQCCNQS